MSNKFKALTPFMYGTNVYNPAGEIYELEDNNLLKAWESQKIVKIVEISQGVASIEKEDSVETVENAPQSTEDELKGLTYKELQDRAKEAGIKFAGVKAADLRKQLLKAGE